MSNPEPPRCADCDLFTYEGELLSEEQDGFHQQMLRAERAGHTYEAGELGADCTHVIAQRVELGVRAMAGGHTIGGTGHHA